MYKDMLQAVKVLKYELDEVVFMVTVADLEKMAGRPFTDDEIESAKQEAEVSIQLNDAVRKLFPS